MITIGYIGGPRDSLTKKDVYYQIQRIMISNSRCNLSLNKFHEEMLNRFPENENVKDLEKALFELCSLDYSVQEDIIVTCSEPYTMPALVSNVDNFEFSLNRNDKEIIKRLSESLNKSDNFLEKKMYTKDYQYSTMYTSKRKGTKKRKKRK